MLLSLLLACADAETCQSDQGDARVCVFMDADSVTGVAGAYVGFRAAGDEQWIDTVADAEGCAVLAVVAGEYEVRADDSTRSCTTDARTIVVTACETTELVVDDVAQWCVDG